MFGLDPSLAAVKALKSFQEKNIISIVELGAGLGRDTVFFAKNSISVQALDYSKASIESINKKSKKLNLTNAIKTKVFDVRKKLPFESNSVEGCFSHMLYCMALSNADLEKILSFSIKLNTFLSNLHYVKTVNVGQLGLFKKHQSSNRQLPNSLLP